MLGGRDFDRAMLNSIVRPWLLQNFDLAADFQTDPAYLRLLRVAQYRSELAKIALSTQVTDRIFADENQVATKDRSGAEIYLDVEVTRSDLEGLVGGEIDRSIALCEKLLTENGYRQGDVDRVVMIGGPSRMPVVRERVAAALGIPVDLQTDPMTAVAIGAAIYAESRDWTGETATSKKSRASLKVSGPLDIQYDYPARTADTRARIRVIPNLGERDSVGLFKSAAS
jgi:molecular chaperone DnaK